VKIIRDHWTPLTVVIETHEEAEVLHKILACVVDDTEERDVPTQLFLALGRNLDAAGAYRASGVVTVTDA
jgi:hypothetical protein